MGRRVRISLEYILSNPLVIATIVFLTVVIGTLTVASIKFIKTNRRNAKPGVHRTPRNLTDEELTRIYNQTMSEG